MSTHGKPTIPRRRKQVLVLDAKDTPLSTTSILKAQLLTNPHGEQRATVLETINAVEGDLPIVIKLNKLVEGFVASVGFSSARVFFRDNYTCQYCGVRFPERELTLDHVIPKSRGGDASWENQATACKACNNRKADRTPEEAGMKLLSVPSKPRDTLVFELMVHGQPHLAQAWVRYLKQLDAALTGAGPAPEDESADGQQEQADANKEEP